MLIKGIEMVSMRDYTMAEATVKKMAEMMVALKEKMLVEMTAARREMTKVAMMAEM